MTGWWHRFLRRAPTVALAGPDGVGKSTALRIAIERLAGEAPELRVEVRKWRPMLLPSLARVAGREEAASDQKPRRGRGNLQWVRLGYYFVDFVVGTWWKDRAGGRPRLIVYDRCALDMVVDPYRFGLASRRGTGLLWRLVPKPRMVILLYDDAGRIRARKDDLEEGDIREQLGRWLALSEAGEVHAVVRADDGAEETAARIVDLVRPVALGRNSVWRARAPRVEIATGSRAAAANSLELYNPQRPAARLARGALKMALRAGAAQPFVARMGAEPLQAHLNEVFGRAVTLSAFSGAPGPRQKRILQVMSRGGEILGYVKTASSPRAAALLQNETQVLRRLSGVRFTSAVTPRVLAAGWRGHVYALVEEAAGAPFESAPLDADERHVRFLAELLQSAPAERRLVGPRGDGLAGFPYYRHIIEGARRFLEREAREAVPWGPAHGDFSSWNTRVSGGRLVVFDWEDGATEVPAGWDLLHFLVAAAVEVRGLRASEVVRRLPGERLMEYAGLVGLPESSLRNVMICYAAHALERSLLEFGDAASTKDIPLRDTWAALLNMWLHRPGMAPAAS